MSLVEVRMLKWISGNIKKELLVDRGGPY
jgi:hypothetical protein